MLYLNLYWQLRLGSVAVRETGTLTEPPLITDVALVSLWGYGGYKPFSYDSYSADNFLTFAHFPTSINLRPQTRNIPNPTLFQSCKSLNPINPALDNYPRTSTTSPLPCLDLTFSAITLNSYSAFLDYTYYNPCKK